MSGHVFYDKLAHSLLKHVRRGIIRRVRRRPHRGLELELKRAIVEDGCLEIGITLDPAALEHAIVTAINADPMIREHAVEPVNLRVTLY